MAFNPYENATLAPWKMKRGKNKGMDVYYMPTDLFDALQVKDKSGKVLTASGFRPMGGINAREYWDLMNLAHQQANTLSPELRQKYGISAGSNPYAGDNPYNAGGAGPSAASWGLPNSMYSSALTEVAKALANTGYYTKGV